MPELPINLNYWILQSIAMGLTALFIPGLRVTSIFGPLGSVVTLAFINAHVWDAALFFQLPTSLTAQTFTLLISNGLIFWIIVKLLPGIEINGILPALIAPVLFTLLSVLIAYYGRNIDWLNIGQLAVTYIGSVKDAIMAGSGAPTPDNAVMP